MRTKKFNQQWHDTNDPQSKAVVIAYMKSLGFGFHENPNKFGMDLISDFENPKVALELEHRSIWEKEQYPYQSVHIPARKLKFLGNDHVHYIVLNKDFNRIGICLGRNLKAYLTAVGEVRNNAVASGEHFLHVPRAEFVWKSIL
jgi:hypothetical protein